MSDVRHLSQTPQLQSNVKLTSHLGKASLEDLRAVEQVREALDL